MVKVEKTVLDQNTAWRVRDELARHPSLGGSTAQIQIRANFKGVQLEGWVLDEHLFQLALKLAGRAAGYCPVQAQLSTKKNR